MSPSSDLSPQPSNPPSEPAELHQPQDAAKASTPVDPSPTSDVSSKETTPAESTANPPLLRKPPLRPVSRPQSPEVPVAPKAGGAASPPEAAPGTKLEHQAAATPVSPSTVAEGALSQEELLAQAALRQQPIPPPSEPKQYRAIGLVRGKYTAAEDEFTRGELHTSDGTALKAVLLGRVMSLVRNHIDLEKEHLWVVYPRTREEEKELHVQIVGIWEPETLKRQDAEGNEIESDGEESLEDFADPRLEDDYFSIRGEIVFLSQDEQLIVVKIQQAPRKSTQKAKAFKLALQGVLDNPRTVGYFWDLHVKRQSNTLVITEATCIGLTPPKKRSKDDERGRGPSRKPQPGGRRPAGRSGPPRPSSPRPSGPREPIAKPLKRTEQSSEG